MQPITRKEVVPPCSTSSTSSGGSGAGSRPGRARLSADLAPLIVVAAWVAALVWVFHRVVN